MAFAICITIHGKKHLKDAAFAKDLSAIARRFVDGVKSGLPQGVQLEEHG